MEEFTNVPDPEQIHTRYAIRLNDQPPNSPVRLRCYDVRGLKKMLETKNTSDEYNPTHPETRVRFTIDQLQKIDRKLVRLGTEFLTAEEARPMKREVYEALESEDSDESEDFDFVHVPIPFFQEPNFDNLPFMYSPQTLDHLLTTLQNSLRDQIQIFFNADFRFATIHLKQYDFPEYMPNSFIDTWTANLSVLRIKYLINSNLQSYDGVSVFQKFTNAIHEAVNTFRAPYFNGQDVVYRDGENERVWALQNIRLLMEEELQAATEAED
jgi:hypothetical protein